MQLYKEADYQRAISDIGIDKRPFIYLEQDENEGKTNAARKIPSKNETVIINHYYRSLFITVTIIMINLFPIVT